MLQKDEVMPVISARFKNVAASPQYSNLHAPENNRHPKSTRMASDPSKGSQRTRRGLMNNVAVTVYTSDTAPTTVRQRKMEVSRS
jgi:hypothetical protein